MNNFGDKNRKQLEEQFRSKFENAQFSPPAHLWEQIDAALDAKPWYKRPLFYWTSGLVAVLLLLVMFWFTLVYENTTSSDAMLADKNKVENNPQNTEKGLTDISSNTISNNNNNEQNNTNAEENTVLNHQEKIKDTNTDIISATPNSKGTNVVTIKSSPSTHNITDKDKNNIAISVVLGGENKDNNENKEVASSNEIAKVTDLEILVLNTYPLDEFVPFAEPFFEMDVVIEKDSTLENAVANSNMPSNIVKKSSGIAITLGANYTQGIYQPSFRRDSLYNGLSVIGAYRDNLADTLPQTNIRGNYTQTGLDIALQFGKNRRWSLNTGLAKGKASYSFGSTNYILIDPTPQGINTKEFSNNQVEVNYEWLQVPIAVGYQFGDTRAKKFSGFAQLGTAIEYLNSYSYTSAAPEFVYALGTHRTINTNVWTQAGINYHITNRWLVWAGGTYKSSLSSLINEEGLTFSSQTYGWQVGTRFTVFSFKKK